MTLLLTCFNISNKDSSIGAILSAVVECVSILTLAAVVAAVVHLDSMHSIHNK